MADRPTTAGAVIIGGGGAGRVVTVNDPAPGEVADEISSGVPGLCMGASGAFAMRRAVFAVDIRGERCPALVQPDAPLRDPDIERLGNVGLAAVQLAAAMGARVTGIAAPAKATMVQEEGAAEVLARDAPLPEDRFHTVIDLVVGPAFPALIDALRPGGHYAVVGTVVGPLVQADLRRIYLRDITLRDITLHGCTYQAARVFARLLEMVRVGNIRPRISATYPLCDIALAQAEFQAKSHAGKLVLLPEKTDE